MLVETSPAQPLKVQVPIEGSRSPNIPLAITALSPESAARRSNVPSEPKRLLKKSMRPLEFTRFTFTALRMFANAVDVPVVIPTAPLPPALLLPDVAAVSDSFSTVMSFSDSTTISSEVLVALSRGRLSSALLSRRSSRVRASSPSAVSDPESVTPPPPSPPPLSELPPSPSLPASVSVTFTFPLLVTSMRAVAAPVEMLVSPSPLLL